MVLVKPQPNRQPIYSLKLCCFFWALLISQAAFCLNLTQLSSSTKGSVHSLDFSFDGTPRYQTFHLSSPARWVIDLSNINLRTDIASYCRKNKAFRRCRYSINKHQKLRLVFDLMPKVKTSVRRLKKNTLRLVFNLTTTPGRSNKPKTKRNLTVTNVQKARDIIVVIDPGHGGKDPGATGRKGTKEKDVVLAIGKVLKYYIDKQPGLRAVLTRKGDNYVRLRDRLALARQYKADVFISVHADAFKNRRSNGASVFALSQRGATSEAARWLAEKENYSELGGVDLTGLNDTTGLVRSVLIDLSQTATIGSSLRLGEEVLGSLGKLTRLHNDKVEQARFVVLKSPDIPSILIETGFISNPREERNLASRRYRQRLALSVLGGLKRYFWQNPPRGTYLAKHRQRYRVVKGDSFIAIAKRFGVSVKALKRVNKVAYAGLRRGQLLNIPELS